MNRCMSIAIRLSRVYALLALSLFITILSAIGAEAPPAQKEDLKAPAPLVLPADYFQVDVSHAAMSAKFDFTIIAPKKNMTEGAALAAATEAFDAIDRLESRISTWQRGTQASRINSEGAQHPVGVAADVLDMVELSVKYWTDTDGAFDITVGPLVELWRACKAVPRVPTDQEIAEARALVGCDKLIVLHDDHSVGFKKPGMRVDFGGIGKGLAVDEAARVLEQYGITCALLDGGTSSMVAMGAPPGKEGWVIRLKHPYDDGYFDEVTIKDEAISTSGYLHDYFEVNGKKYGHIINPKTGMPVQGMIYAMSIAPTGAQTEALSKGFFVNGVEWSRLYCKTHPEARAILVPEPEAGKEPKPVRVNFKN